MKFEFMASSDAQPYTMKFLCENLRVSKSGFYKWSAGREARLAKIQREYLLVRKIEQIHIGSKQVYGSPTVYGILRILEPDVSQSKVERLMKKSGIRSKTKKKFKVTTDSNSPFSIQP